MKKSALILFAVSLLLIGIYVPVRIEGFDKTFWVFSFDISRLGEKGALWHFYKIAQNLDWRYFLAELFIVYSLFFGLLLYIKRHRGRKAQRT